MIDNSYDIPCSTAEELDIRIGLVMVNSGKETYLDAYPTSNEFWKKAEESG